ncbi:MAG: long-chain-fatty-acid--CoA ligase [Pseudomonadales bacterium]|nr:long-chain-fatty-acid--CoA ligase [Pseudomonadales bacterium]
MNASVNFDILSPISFLQRSVTTYPNKTAIIYGDTQYTYRDFANRVYQLASALQAKGIGRNDKVAFVCPNTPAMLEAHFAVPLIGAALVTVNTRLAPAEIAYIIAHSESKAVFVDTEFSPTITKIKSELNNVELFINIVDDPSFEKLDAQDYEDFLGTGSTDIVASAVEDEYDTLAINYTSGTTGRPKGVMFHHRGAYLNALAEVMEAGVTYKSTYLWTLPLFHCNGWCYSWGIIAVGGTHVCLRAVEPEVVFDLIKSEGVTHLCGAPTVLIGLNAFAESSGRQFENPITITTAGAPPAPAIIQSMENIGAHIIHVYGLTEVFGPYSICAEQKEWDQLSTDETAQLKARQGVPFVMAHYMDVVDRETMVPVPRDGKTVGEIVMRGNMVMSGYYKNPEATAEAFKGGWFHSGDLAVIHADNYVQILDRAKDIIISGGENISTVEVEAVIYQHPSVLETAVVPVPDEKWGEVPKAFITLKPGLKPEDQPSPEDIIAFCKEKIARYKAPKFVEFMDLPKTATGKIQKFKLREKEWEGHEKRVN